MGGGWEVEGGAGGAGNKTVECHPLGKIRKLIKNTRQINSLYPAVLDLLIKSPVPI